ncbi:hypothetical protein ON010_g8061 [Phytophthora cinnamomi]|nr:hypothetical protein ON010_g8061 [Phytophthora cinnamomi]
MQAAGASNSVEASSSYRVSRGTTSMLRLPDPFPPGSKGSGPYTDDIWACDCCNVPACRQFGYPQSGPPPLIVHSTRACCCCLRIDPYGTGVFEATCTGSCRPRDRTLCQGPPSTARNAGQDTSAWSYLGQTEACTLKRNTLVIISAEAPTTGFTSLPIRSISISTMSAGGEEERSHLRGAREDERALGQRAVLRELADELGDREDHVARVGLLHLLPVEVGGDLERLRVRDDLGRHEHGAQRAEGVEGLGAAPLAAALLALPAARRDVVGARVAAHEAQRLVLRHVATGLLEHHGQLALVVDLGRARGHAGDHHGVVRVLQRVDALGEEHGELGLGHIGLLGVFAVVEADAQDLRRHHGRQHLLDGGGFAREEQRAQRVVVLHQQRRGPVVRALAAADGAVLVHETREGGGPGAGGGRRGGGGEEALGAHGEVAGAGAGAEMRETLQRGHKASGSGGELRL